MMPEATPFAAALRAGLLAVLVLATGACSTTPRTDGEAAAAADADADAPRGEAEALLAAQAALRDGDCRKASDLYLAAARSSSDPDVSMRASQLALGCENLPAGRAATARWRELAPYSGEAALAAALVAMKRYDYAESRAALEAWRDSGHAGSQDPLSFAAVLQEEADATLLYRVFDEVLVGEDPTAEVLLAQARMALGAYNMQAALDAATRALALDTDLLEARIITVRAQAMLGEHDAAIAAARALPEEALQGEDAFLLADLLQGAGRSADADAELTRLAAAPGTAAGAERRRVALALRNGQLEEVERGLQALAEAGGNTAIAILYFSQLSERRGEVDRAIQGYRVLADSPMGLTARASAARLLLEQGKKDEALAFFDEYQGQDLQETLQAGLTRAQLLVEADDLKGALATLDELVQRFPEHPDIDYMRATVLESGGRTRQAVGEFERAMRLRPEDPQLMNALGYTLADHDMRLRDAEQLVRKAIAISPDNPAIQDSLGWVLYRRGAQDEALQVLERAWFNSRDAEIGAHFGEVLWKAGEESQARYVWQQALAGEPDHAGLRSTIARLTGEDAD